MLQRRGVGNTAQKGFALIEVILVVIAITVLAVIVIAAANPHEDLANSRNVQRSLDANTILAATYQYTLDNNGAVPSGVTSTPIEVCATTTASCKGLINLKVLTAEGKYLVTIPEDPLCSSVCATGGVGYQMSADANGRLVVSAPYAENGKTIVVTK